MATFIVRVELYGSPSEEIYTKLHAAMAQKGFSRSFEDGGKNYNFPHAMYGLFDSSISTTQVLEMAKQAAATVWKDFAVLVTRTEVRFEHFGLKPA